MKNLSCGEQYYELWFLLAQTRDAIFKAREKELDRYHISATQAAALSVIQDIGGKVTPTEISRRLFREPYSVSGLLSRMEKEGLIRKARDLDKKNMVRVVLTDKGNQFCQQSAVRKSIGNIMSSLSEEECQQLKLYLERLQGKAFEEIAVNHKRPIISSRRAVPVKRCTVVSEQGGPVENGK